MNSTEPIAKNHIRISHALFNEGMRAAGSNEYKKSVKKVAFILLFIFAVAAIYVLYTGGSLFFFLGEGIFLAALLFWLMIMLPNTRRKSRYKAMARGTDSVPERTTTFYTNHLSVLTNDGQNTIIQYSDITNLQETKNLYLINLQNNISVLLDKKGFITGNFDIIKREIEASIAGELQVLCK